MAKPMKKKRKSKFDGLFEFKIEENVKIGTCKICPTPEPIKMTGKNTNGLWRHLSAAHPEEFDKIRGSASAGEANPDPIKPIESKDIALWISKKYLPLNFFEDGETKEFFHRLNPTITFPNRKALKNLILTEYQTMKGQVDSILKANDSKFSFTVDGWTSIANKSFYGITIHYIDKDWTFRSLALDFVASEGSHTGKDIAKIFAKCLTDHGIEGKVQGITLDNASVNTSFLKELHEIMPEIHSEDSHFRCIAHVLNLAVQDLLKKLNLAPAGNINEEKVFEIDTDDEADTDYNVSSENAVAKIRSLFLKTKRSEQITNKFNTACSMANCPEVAPSIDVRTRWNSTHDMIRKAVAAKDALDTLCNIMPELSIFKLNSSEWTTVEKVSNFLKNFKKLTENLGGENYATLPMVIVSFNLLLDKIEEKIKNLSSIKKKERSALDDNLLKAFEACQEKMLKHYRKTNWVYCAVLVLDPRFKTDTFMLTNWGKELYLSSMDKFKEIYSTYFTADKQMDLVTEGEAQASSEDENDEIDFEELYCKDEHKLKEEQELEQYLALPRAKANTNILEWWKIHSEKFPTLSKMARDLLAIPATSVPAERLFSRAALVLRKHRNRLSPDTAKSLLLLNNWTTSSLASKINPSPCSLSQEL